MKSKLCLSHLPYKLFAMIVFIAILLIPTNCVLADANPPPTATNTPEVPPTEAPIPEPSNTPLPTNTPIPILTNTPESILDDAPDVAVPPPASNGLSLFNRALLVLLAIATVIVMGIIVYAIYYRTRGEGLDER